MAKQSRSLSSLSLYDLPDRPINKIWGYTHHTRTRLVCKQARDSIDAYYWSNCSECHKHNYGSFLKLIVTKKAGDRDSVAVPLPFVLPRELGCNKNISILRLSNTAITDISALKNLKQLAYLELRNTSITDISALKNLKQLTTLRLTDTEITDISALAKLKQLAELFLGNTAITDISPLANLTQLTFLSLSNTQVSDISLLKNLKQLSCLYLCNTKVSDISALVYLEQLQWLNLSNTKVSGISTLAKLKQLTYLFLSNTKIKGIPDQLLMTNIMEIVVYNCPDLVIKTRDRRITGYKQTFPHWNTLWGTK